MINTKFESYKLRREIKKVGEEYEFNRAKTNEYKEPIDEKEVVAKISGLYHEQNSKISITTGETTQTRNKKIPMILCLYEDAKPLKVGDVVEINSKKFNVTGVVNIQEWNIISDISLEVVDEVV